MHSHPFGRAAGGPRWVWARRPVHGAQRPRAVTGRAQVRPAAQRRAFHSCRHVRWSLIGSLHFIYILVNKFNQTEILEAGFATSPLLVTDVWIF